MKETIKTLTELKEWQDLCQHQAEIGNQHMREWFEQDDKRFEQFSIKHEGLFFDYSRNRITKETIQRLCSLARAVKLQEKVPQLFAGQPINTTEKRAVLHSALRNKLNPSILVNGKDVQPQIAQAQQKLRDFIDQIHQGKWLGVTGKPVKHIVNVGIGGSHLGPMMATYALKDFAVSDLKFHFISSVDKQGLDEIINQIDPETTLFIVSSKTFSTIETLTNAQTISVWMRDQLGNSVLKKQFVAVTSAADKAIEFGIHRDHIFPLWDWVGGRYSIWSAIGLPLMLMLGNAQFDDFLLGAYQMDQHFQQAAFEQNIPVLLALLSIWYMNFFGSSVQAVIPYSHRLRYLIPYLQQAEMESNGKSIDLDGKKIAYATGPVIFGEEGCNGQHAYHQLLLQGNHFIPVDFILVGKGESYTDDRHHDILIASGLSQAQALMRGKTYAEAHAELIALNYPPDEAARIAHHRVIPGNRPSNLIFMEKLTPKNLGSLIALYEHKIFVQGVIWNINSFDQWGVELGKQLLPTILDQIQGTQSNDLDSSTDSSTRGLINILRKKLEPV